MLKMTGVKLTSNYLLKKRLRGGISYIAKRYAKVSNNYTNDYDLNNS